MLKNTAKGQKLILIPKVDPLGKGQLKYRQKRDIDFHKKHRVNLDTKVDPLGKGQLKIDRKETFISSGFCDYFIFLCSG